MNRSLALESAQLDDDRQLRLARREILALRATTVIPMLMLGFNPAAMNPYIVVNLYATFVGLRPRPAAAMT